MNSKTLLRQSIALASCIISFCGFGQNALQATFNTTINTICDGSGCDYEGPSILINEMMMSPSNYDGSMWSSNCSAQCGEWIEIYNPNLCEPIDVSCYYLGNNAADGNGLFTVDYPGGYVIPQGTIIPPAGFLLLRGSNAPAVPSNLLVQNGGNTIEIVVQGSNVCVGSGTRLWFPNSGGWFAFYDANGVPQDAVSWGSSTTLGGYPCVPASSCGFSGTLPSYNQIPANRKTVVYGAIPNSWGQSIRRVPDGGAWATNQGTSNLTPGNCNATCIPTLSSTCDGTATINVTGGTAPYTYAWNDSEVQTTQTATGLCAGTYTCQVTDANGTTQAFQVEIIDFVPDVTLSIQDEVCIDAAAVTATGSPQASGSATGVFSGTGMSGASFAPATAGTGTHTLTYTYTDAHGCQNSATDAITVNPLPVVSITNVETPYCVEIETANIQFSPAGGQLNGTGIVSNQFSPSAAGTGTHNLVYEYTDANGCENSATVAVAVIQAAPPVITAPDDLCIDGDTVYLQATPAGGQFQVNGSNASMSFVPGNYGSGIHALSYSYTDVNNCIGSATESIHIHALPVITMNVNPVYCYGTGFTPVVPQPSGGTFTGNNVVSGGLNLSSVDPGNYSVHYEVTSEFGCYSEQTANYTIPAPLFPGFDYTVDCFQKIGGTAHPINPAYQYKWNFGSDAVSGTTLSYYVEEAGNYPLTLTITDQYGCHYDTTGIVHIPTGVSPSDFTVPNVITPNGDGINDYLAMPVELDDCFEYDILILNRWGSVVFEMHNKTAVFNGKDKHGRDLTEGVYFYQVRSNDFDCNDPELKGFCSGFITIVR